jgi:hypothetical protein
LVRVFAIGCAAGTSGVAGAAFFATRALGAFTAFGAADFFEVGDAGAFFRTTFFAVDVEVRELALGCFVFGAAFGLAAFFGAAGFFARVVFFFVGSFSDACFVAFAIA